MIYTKMLPRSKSSSTDLLKKAINIASCYGFDNINKVILQQKKQSDYLKEKDGASAFQKKQHSIKQSARNFNTDITGNEVVSALKTAIDNELLPSDNPILLYQSNLSSDSAKNDGLRFGLIAIGMKKSIAEALVIKTASSILEDIGIVDVSVYINSIGDRGSSAKFVNELNSYFRKNINSVSSQVRHSVKKDIFKAYDQLCAKCGPLKDDAPQSIKFLSDDNRKHLSEVLEYMETADVPYEIDNFLIGDNDCYSQTLFEIRCAPRSDYRDDSVLAKGGRYDELVKRMFNVDISAVGIVFEFEKKSINIKEKGLDIFKRTKKPQICFIQLGVEAKKRSLLVIDILRRSNIYAHHSLDNNKFSEQLSFARFLNVPYAIIIGHREALDGTVIVRNMDTQFQNTVLLDELPLYLSKINL